MGSARFRNYNRGVNCNNLFPIQSTVAPQNELCKDDDNDKNDNNKKKSK